MPLTQVQGAMVGPTGFANLSGITFPATQVPSADANTLDDYEEGTWTPSVGGTATYGTRIGRYTKVGNLVSAVLVLTISSIGTGASAYVTGLPFIPSVTTAGSLSLYLNIGTALTTAGCYAETDGIVYLTGNTAAATSSSLNGGGTILQNSSTIWAAITYRV